MRKRTSRCLLAALFLTAAAPLALGCGAQSLPAGGGRTGPLIAAQVEPDATQGATPVVADTAPSQPAPSTPGAWVGAAPGTDAMLPGAQDAFVAVWVDIPKDLAEAHAPAAVGLVIDTSGSMAGDKIKHARAAAQKLVDNLRDGDIVSLTTFNDSAAVRVQAVKLDKTSRAMFKTALSEVTANGGTNLFEGVRQAGLSVMDAPATHAVKRVVLISDGNATVGETANAAIGNLGEKAGDRGVQLTAIGVGLDYNEETLNQLAMRSSGRLYHLTNSDKLPEMVQSEIALLKATRATGTKLAVVPAPGVEIVRVEGARTISRASGGIEVPLGSMFGGQRKELVVRVRLVAPESGKHPLASVRLTFADANDGNLERVQETVARYEANNDKRVVDKSKNEQAQAVLAMIDASKSATVAAVAMNREDFANADKQLAEAEENLRRVAKASSNETDRQRLEASANKMKQAREAGAGAAAAPAPARAKASRDAALRVNDSAMDMAGF